MTTSDGVLAVVFVLNDLAGAVLTGVLDGAFLAEPLGVDALLAVLAAALGCGVAVTATSLRDTLFPCGAGGGNC